MILETFIIVSELLKNNVKYFFHIIITDEKKYNFFIY
jgi:hypothetical protein